MDDRLRDLIQRAEQIASDETPRRRIDLIERAVVARTAMQRTCNAAVDAKDAAAARRVNG